MILAFLLLAAAVAALVVAGGDVAVSGTNSRAGSGNVTTVTTTASAGDVSGGTAPYSYLWQYVSGDAASINAAAAANTSFFRTSYVVSDDSVSFVGIYRCRVTDALGGVSYGPNCTVTTTHNAFL